MLTEAKLWFDPPCAPHLAANVTAMRAALDIQRFMEADKATIAVSYFAQTCD
jgi:hypothetical protein